MILTPVEAFVTRSAQRGGYRTWVGALIYSILPVFRIPLARRHHGGVKGIRTDLVALIAIGSLLTSASPAIAVDDNVMEQTDSPIQIVEFTSEFGGRDNDYIVFEARYLNTTDRPIIGIKYGFIAYDLFNESLGGLSGVKTERGGLDGGEDDSSRWQTRARGVARAHETGIAYVQKVRFADGELWIADRDELAEKLDALVPGGGASLLGDEDQ